MYETKEEEITFRRKTGILDAWMEKNFDLAKSYSNVVLIYTYTTYVNCIYINIFVLSEKISMNYR